MAIKKNPYFDDLDTISPAERDNRLNAGLRRAVENAYWSSPYTRDLMNAAGVVPDQIRTMGDLELLPITRKTELIEAQKANPPFGGLLTARSEDVERVFISPGPIYEYQPSGLPWFARAFHAAGFGKGDIVVNTFTYHMSPAGILFHEGLRQVGATVVVMGTGNTDALIRTMLDLRVTGFLGTPTYLMSVIKRTEEMFYDFNKQFTLKKAWFTGEMLPSSLRKVFEETYHISTSQAYAVTEPGGAIAYECPEKNGMHIMEEYALEIVDPQTGRQLKPGEIGEIVVTPIHNPAWGLVRFGTGDLASYSTKPCPCGRTSHKISNILGRAGDAVKVRGMFVVAKQAEEVITSFKPVAKFRITVDRKESRDEMNLKVELKDASANKAELSAEINQKFQDICRVKFDRIDFVPAGNITEPHKTIEDIRKWE